jgi:hypothetical protein
MNSVFPVVSSSKTSQIIIVSTTNGSGNEFYRIWNKAVLNKNKAVEDGAAKWTPVKIDWWEVPGRDEKWKREQMETFNGSEERFNQEYGNCVGGNSIVSVYDIEKNEYKEITIKELYEYLNKMNNIIESEETNGK